LIGGSDTRDPTEARDGCRQGRRQGPFGAAASPSS